MNCLLRTSHSTAAFSLLVILLACLDRLTKWYALQLKEPVVLTPFLQWVLHFNRGISFSLLHSTSAIGYWSVTIAIGGMVGYLLYYTHQQYRGGGWIWPELLVIGGAASNLADRFIYAGVIDFIAVSYGTYHFPVFNIADMMIVSGVVGMCLMTWYES
jgi:signal peptidase II